MGGGGGRTRGGSRSSRSAGERGGGPLRGESQNGAPGGWGTRRRQQATSPSAPPGMHTITVSAKFAPFDLTNGSWETESNRFADRIIATLAQYAPNISRAIVATHWRSPLTMETEYGLTRGDVFHGAILPYQMFSFRPIPGWSSYRTPIRGLYLCGAGAHPGGGVIGAAGHNAAMAVLEAWPGFRFA